MTDLVQVPDQAEWYDEVPRSIVRHAVFGLGLMLVAFGGFGVWAFRAPLAAAVISQGSFVATGQNKIVQHLEGGIIEEILIAEGTEVREGQPILRLDETLVRANRRELFLRQFRLETTEYRLLAQNLGKDTLDLPPELLAESGDPEVASILDSQRLSFMAARSGLSNDILLIERNMDALEARHRGYSRQLESLNAQVLLLDEELASKDELLSSGLARRADVMALRRASLDAKGQIGRLQAEIDEVSEMRAKFLTQMERTRDEYSLAALTELQAIQGELESVREQVRKAQNVLTRTDVLAPVSGTVVRLYYNTAGGVIEPGRAIAEILPDDVPLIIETLVSRSDIDTVKIGLTSTVRLVGLNQRTTPILNGTVEYVSADAVAQASDQPAKREVYVVRISLTEDEISRVSGFVPKPGMPVQIMIKTEERTFAQYIAKPIVDSMTRAFREQ